MKRSLLWCLAGLMLVSFAGCKRAPDAGAAAAAAAPAADAAAPAAAPAADAAAPAADAADAADAAAAAPAAIPAPSDVAAPPADAVKTESGLAYKKLTANEAGRAIVSSDLVRLHYTGWTTDGKMFDSSLTENTPVVFTPENLIPGMKEGLLLSKVGEKVRVWIPQDLAYQGRPGAPEGMLVFDFDILDVVTPVMPPKDVPSDATQLTGGISYRIVKTEAGAQTVSENDIVSLDFTGWTQTDGVRFQSSLEMPEKLMAPVSSLFPGWKAVIPNTHKGDVVQMWIPQELGIDPEGAQLKGTLIFEVTVANVTKMPTAPADVAAPGSDTQKTASGIASRILTPGTGTEHPKATSTVVVNYTGWTTNGEMFDTSIISGKPATFPLNHVIPGWTEAVQLMVKGEKRIVWIPEELAYKGQEGAPQGMLVFEIELLDILPE